MKASVEMILFVTYYATAPIRAAPIRAVMPVASPAAGILVTPGRPTTTGQLEDRKDGNELLNATIRSQFFPGQFFPARPACAQMNLHQVALSKFAMELKLEGGETLNPFNNACRIGVPKTDAASNA